MKINLVVTRHPGLIDYLVREKIVSPDVEVRAHATPDLVRGKHVLGVLPHSLSCLTASFTEIPLDLPPELRGAELTAEDVERYASAPVIYRVKKL